MALAFLLWRKADDVSGSLVPPDFQGLHGTAARLIRQTCMNDQRKTKHLHGDLSANAGRRARNAIWANRRAFRRQSAEPDKIFAVPYRCLHPARSLMIDLGWLRLFQVIVSGYRKPAARRPSLYET